MSKRLKGMVLEASLWFGFCALAYISSYRFDEPFSDYRYGAAGWPRAVIIVLVACAIMLLVTSVLTCGRRRGQADFEQEEVPAECEAIQPRTPAEIIKLIGAFFVPLAYLFLMPRMGFYLTTPFLITGYMYLLGERRLIHLLGTGLLIYALCILIFTVLLYVPLPVGNWSGFYEVNNAFLSLIK